MEPKFYVENIDEPFSKYSYDFLKFDMEGKIDWVRTTDGLDYLLEEDIHLPKLETEFQYIEYLTGKYINKDMAALLQHFVGYKLEMITPDEVTVNNVIAFDNPRGYKKGEVYVDAFEAQMEATMEFEFALVDALTDTLEVIRTLLHNDGETNIRPVIRVK